MLPLTGRHAVITGGSRGIGLAVAHKFASAGAAVTLVGRQQAALDAALETLPKLQHHRSLAFSVSQPEEWDRLTAAKEAKERPIDILVNAAGIAQHSLLVRTAPEDAQAIVDTNLMGTIYGCRAVTKAMMRQKTRGCIINISSLLASHGGYGSSVYAASKAGIVALTRSLACETASLGIRVNAILPGYIQTDMTKSLDAKGALSAKIPLGRLGTGEEVADAAMFLVGNQYANNCVLNLDGGLSATMP